MSNKSQKGQTFWIIFLKRRSGMNEEDLKELLELLATDYGRGYLDGVVGGLSMLLKISKKDEKE